MDKRLQAALSVILEKLNPKFFGTVTLSFQAGKLCDWNICQTYKPKDYGID